MGTEIVPSGSGGVRVSMIIRVLFFFFSLLDREGSISAKFFTESPARAYQAEPTYPSPSKVNANHRKHKAEYHWHSGEDA